MKRASLLLTLLALACKPASATTTSTTPSVDGTRVELTGFSLVVPKGWQTHEEQHGLAMKSPDGRTSVEVSGGYPAADATPMMRVIASGVAPLRPAIDWETREIAGRSFARARWADEREQLDAYMLVEDDIALVITIDAALPIDPTSESAARSVLESVKPRGLVVGEARLQDPCPASVRAAFDAKAGACMEPAVLGEERTRACAATLAGGIRDADAEAALGQQTGKTLECYRAP